MPALPQITGWNVLEILLIAVVFYQFLLLVRGTRAAQMLVGIGTLAILLFTLRRLQLPVINWITDHLLPYLIFAIIVVFQAEIRHILPKNRRIISYAAYIVDTDSFEYVVNA